MITRLLLISALLFLSGLTTKYPVFEPFDLEEHEGEKIALYYMKIVEREGSVYYAETSLTGKRVRILSDGDFAPGEVVSFYGLIKEGMLVNEEYRLHPYPNALYYLSALGLMLFLVLFLRKWRFSLREMRFKEA
jgi:hypothetical protein